jgi:hypothetical protein
MTKPRDSAMIAIIAVEGRDKKAPAPKDPRKNAVKNSRKKRGNRERKGLGQKK